MNRLIDPGSEFRVHRQWFDQSAMDELLGEDFVVAEKNRLYRCLDRLLAHKQELFVYLKERWRNLFNARFDVLLYDLTSTYFEGQAEENPKAKRGYSRDGRPDCLQVVIALIVTSDGFPLAYEVMDGNTSDRTTLRYLVGTPRRKINKLEKQWLELPWQKVRESVEVKLWSEEEELFVLAKSEGRRAKEVAIRRKKLGRYLRSLRAMRHTLPSRDQLMMRIGAAESKAGRAAGYVNLRLPGKDELVTRESFSLEFCGIAHVRCGSDRK